LIPIPDRIAPKADVKFGRDKPRTLT